MSSYARHPTDDSLVIGDNGHVYAATRLPETGWHFEIAWGILDTVKPGVIPVNVRLLLAGQIAGALLANNNPTPMPAPAAKVDDGDVVRILVQSRIPHALEHAWLQHLRDFDAAHPDCHFEAMIQTGRTVPVRDMVEMLKVDPELTIEQVFQRMGGELRKAGQKS